MFFTILGLAARETFQMTVNQTGGNPLKAVSGQSRPTISFLEHQDARLLGRDRETARNPIKGLSLGPLTATQLDCLQRVGNRWIGPPGDYLAIHHSVSTFEEHPARGERGRR